MLIKNKFNVKFSNKNTGILISGVTYFPTCNIHKPCVDFNRYVFF